MSIDPTITKEPGTAQTKTTGPFVATSLGWGVEGWLDEDAIDLDEDDLEGPREPEDE